jgi:iron(III) transport system substrate-binding protein
MTASLTRRHLLAASAAGTAMLAAPAIVRASSEINLYSSRHYDTDEALYTNFTKQTGIGINRIEAKAGELIERLKAEGKNSPADVFLTVDAGNLERANVDGLFQPVRSDVLAKAIPSYLRHADGSWFGFSKRARVIMIARDRIKAEQVPSYESLADEAIKGKLLIRSSGNIYNQSLMGSIIAANGADKAEAWAKGVVANMARAPKGGDTDQIRAVAAGEGDICVSNTYYLGRLARVRQACRQGSGREGPDRLAKSGWPRCSREHLRRRRCPPRQECRRRCEVPRVPGVRRGPAFVRGRQRRISGRRRCQAAVSA